VSLLLSEAGDLIIEEVGILYLYFLLLLLSAALASKSGSDE
jgi:hypothetical protein